MSSSKIAEEIMRTPAHPHCMRKIGTFFRAKNQVTKGVMTRRDFEHLSDRYRDAANMNSLREKQMRRKMLKVWEDYFEEVSKLIPLTQEAFSKAILYKGTEKVKATASHYGDVFFDLIDINADGQISPSEFRLFHKVFNLSDKTSDAAFQKLDKGNKGYVSYDEFIDAIINIFNPEAVEPAPEDIIFGPLID